MVVEDDAEDLDLVKQAFTEINYSEVFYFTDAFQLLKYLKTNDTCLPALIVTDYKMPKIDGFNLVAFLKRNELFGNINVVMLTGIITETEKQRLLTTGVSKVYLKPHSYEKYISLATELANLAKGTSTA